MSEINSGEVVGMCPYCRGNLTNGHKCPTAIDNFVQKEKYNSAFADGFRSGLEHAEKTIRGIESRLYADLKACGFKSVDPPGAPIFEQIIREMRERA